MRILTRSQTLGMLSALLILGAPMMTSATTVTAAFNAGDLIKGSGAAVYYFAPNGKRYVFPNEKTYFSWFKDFGTVKQIPDEALSAILIGGNVTYKPGSKMVKITTDPKVYAVDQGGVLRWVQTPQLAETLYGLAWKEQIQDLPDPFFINYRIGTTIVLSADFVPTSIQSATPTITQDKQIDESNLYLTIGSVNIGFVPNSITVKRGTTITWTNMDLAIHQITGVGWESGLLTNGMSYARTFTQPGSYSYSEPHASMRGVVNVL